MSHADDHDYFRQRAERERLLACSSDNPVAAKVHLTLAREYDRRAARPAVDKFHLVPRARPEQELG
jgi:hypothetical protein